MINRGSCYFEHSSYIIPATMADVPTLKKRLLGASALQAKAKQARIDVGATWEDAKKDKPDLDFDKIVLAYELLSSKEEDLGYKMDKLKEAIDQQGLDEVAQKGLDVLSDIESMEDELDIDTNILS